MDHQRTLDTMQALNARYAQLPDLLPLDDFRLFAHHRPGLAGAPGFPALRYYSGPGQRYWISAAKSSRMAGPRQRTQTLSRLASHRLGMGVGERDLGFVVA